MSTVKDIFEYLNNFAPCNYKMDFDNVGLLVGDKSKTVKKVILALDITTDVISEGVEIGADLIVSHHPLFFSLKSIDNDDVIGSKIIKIIKNDMSAICMHTNLDATVGGVNDMLAGKLGLQDAQFLHIDKFENNVPISIGRYGVLGQEMQLQDFLSFVKDVLKTKGLRYYNAGRPVNKVAVLGGSGGSDIGYALEHGCDTFVTSDIKYDVFLTAQEKGINLIDADHFCTENVIIPELRNLLNREFPNLDIMISEKHTQVIDFA